jgi:hypothetical protein
MASSDIVASSSSHGSRSVFTVYGVPFSIGDKYEPIKALGKGAYGVVWFVGHLLAEVRLVAMVWAAAVLLGTETPAPSSPSSG